MNLEINENILYILTEGQLDITDFFILMALKENHIELLDILDGNMKREEITVLHYQKLFRRGYIKLSNAIDEQMFELTENGIKLLETIKNQ